MQVNEEKLEETLDILEGTLSCPKIYDINSEDYEKPCCHNNCRDCWKEYITE